MILLERHSSNFFERGSMPSKDFLTLSSKNLLGTNRYFIPSSVLPIYNIPIPMLAASTSPSSTSDTPCAIHRDSFSNKEDTTVFGMLVNEDKLSDISIFNPYSPSSSLLLLLFSVNSLN